LFYGEHFYVVGLTCLDHGLRRIAIDNAEAPRHRSCGCGRILRGLELYYVRSDFPERSILCHLDKHEYIVVHLADAINIHTADALRQARHAPQVLRQVANPIFE
tara:strand:+ start:10586 stop:10897 length:312 start_codon:yes stop_codon:yes gene_type:complete